MKIAVITTLSSFADKRLIAYKDLKDAALAMLDAKSKKNENYWLSSTQVIDNKVQKLVTEQDIIDALDNGFSVILKQGCSQYVHCEYIDVI